MTLPVSKPFSQTSRIGAAKALPVGLRHINPSGKLALHRPPQISDLTTPILFQEEGRSRVVTNAGRDVVDATASARH